MYRTIQRAILLAVGITLPMEAVSVQIANIPLSAAKMATALLLILVAMQFALTTKRNLPRDRAYIPLAVFAASVAISAVIGMASGVPLRSVLLMMTRYLALVVFYVMLVYVVRTRDDLVLVVWALVIGGAVCAIPTLLDIRSGRFLTSGARTVGLAGQANALSYELLICMCAAFALYFTTRSRLRQLLLLGSVALMMLAVIGSLSRSAFLSIAVMWAYWAWRSGRSVERLKYVLPGAAAAILLFLVLPQPVHDRIRTMVDPAERSEDGSIQSRFQQLQWTGSAVAHSPLVGVGLNNFLNWAQHQPGGHTVRNTIHSGYLDILAEQGLLGFVPWITIILLSWLDYGTATSVARARRNRGDPAMRELWTHALFLRIAMLGCMIGALTHPRSDSKGWWLVMAFSTVAVALVRARDRELRTAPVPVAAADERAFGFPYEPGVASARR
jgi:putative inorganic carbon (HCO3(-)) transporter